MCTKKGKLAVVLMTPLMVFCSITGRRKLNIYKLTVALSLVFFPHFDTRNIQKNNDPPSTNGTRSINTV